MKKHHCHVFRHEKLFKKQPLPHYQTHSKSSRIGSLYHVMVVVLNTYTFGDFNIIPFLLNFHLRGLPWSLSLSSFDKNIIDSIKLD
jgi:hypothetical protein